MKATDFRIGNWIDSSEDGYFQIEQLCKLSPDSMNQNVGARYRKGSFWTDCEAVIGIPLTKDRLLKMGCKPMQNGVWTSVTNLKAELHFEIHPNTDEIVTSLQSDFGEIIFDRIKYVHEVQNLYYSLTKEELVLAVTPF